LKEIIQDTPESEYAAAAINELLYISLTQDNGFESLKQYLSSIELLTSIEDLKKRAENSEVWCNIKLENYSAAIIKLEENINNPTDIEDSIFSLIDLSYIYFLLSQDTLKQMPVISIEGVSCKDHEEFLYKTKNWIDILYLREQNKYLDNIEVNKYKIEISPNPTNKFIQIKIISDGPIIGTGIITIHDEIGRTLKSEQLMNNSQSESIKLVNISDLIAGTYFVSLSIAKQLVAQTRMIVN
jgi:hypothetical protein